MSRNIQSDGIAEDLIRGFVQMACAEIHLKTLLEKYFAQMDNGLIDVEDDVTLREHTEKIDDTITEIGEIAEVRRGIMLRLFNMYNGDKDQWCMVKHLGAGAYTLFEAYEASEDDEELLRLALDANKRFVKALSRFLGTEITDCAACFADALKGVKNGD